MSERLSEQDQFKLARAADHIHRAKEEADRVKRELEQADDATLRVILYDRASPTLSRQIALFVLMSKDHLRRDGTLSRIILPLLDDPDEELARLAIKQAPRDDPEVIARLHALLDDSRSRCWSEAAGAIAMRKDTTIVPRLLGWFREGDRAHRNVAWACLYFYGLLERDACCALLREAWDTGDRDDEDRVTLAVGLLGLGDRVGWTFLVEFARRADHYSACWAAETILEHDPALGFDLMLHILDHGTTFQVRWGMVEKIANAAGLPHVWTADGLAEARMWVEQQRLDPQRRDLMPNLVPPAPKPR
ncbi:hypothetical protein BH23PLA1_BH23PLA1_16500 [soil metagenome]